MIFQVSINLEIENKNVQAIIDFDTGFIGFTELVENETTEYQYNESPFEFKKALLNKLEPLLAKNNLINYKISCKNENK